MYGVAGTWRDALWLNTSWGRPNNRATMTNLMQLHTLRCWGVDREWWSQHQTVLIKRRQGAADQRRSQRGEGGGRRRLRLLLIVLPVFSLWGGWRWEDVEKGGQGSPHGQQLTPCVPENKPTSLQWVAHWSHWISDWHRQPVTTTKTLSKPIPLK